MVRIILLLSIFLLGFGFSLSTTPKIIKVKTNISQGKAFYIAAQTGDKTSLHSKNKIALKEFGLIHLLTPSGIHLSSILGIFLIFLPRKFHIGIFLFALILVLNQPGLFSLKRVLYFQIISFFLKGSHKNQISFVLTFLLDALLGGYNLSPLSYAYSFLFWGVIIFTNGGFAAIALNLFLAQLIAIYFTSSSINFFSIIINPIITTLYSFLFPMFSFNYWVVDSDWATDLIIKTHSLLIGFIYLIKVSLSNYVITSHPLILFLPFIKFLKQKSVLTALLLFCLNLGPSLKNSKEKQVYYSIPERSEYLSKKKESLIFIDLKCKMKLVNFLWDFNCKKRPSQFGGPVI